MRLLIASFPARGGSALGWRFSDSSLSVLGLSVTDKKRTGKLISENRELKTDN